MSVAPLRLIDGQAFVSRALLVNRGLSENTVKGWHRCTRVRRTERDGHAYYHYDTLPPTVRTRLGWPDGEAVRRELGADQQAAEAAQRATAARREADAVTAAQNALAKAHDKEASKPYRDTYSATFGPVKGWPVAQRFALWARLVKLAEDGTAPAVLWQAHTELVGKDEAYTVLDTFRRALKKAQAAWGAGNPDAFVLHGNLGNAHAADEHQTLHEYLARALWSTGLALSKTAVARLMAAACAQVADAKSAYSGQPVTIAPPSESWVKQYLLRPDVQRHTDAARYGADYARRHLPYMAMRPALYANDQWQIDGWNVPLYCRGEKGRVTRPVMVVVMDVYSRRLVGWAFGERETGDVILAALRHAVETTGVVPASVVSDKHSFNSTPEAAYLKQHLAPFGCHWTATTNPQAKSILERFFGQFEQRYWLTQPGFVAAGPADRRPTARLKPERRTDLLKTAHQYEWGAAVLLTADLVARYNADALPGRADAPNALYEAGAVADKRALAATDVMRLFWLTREVKASRGGITLQRGTARYRFTFRTAADIERWGNSPVLVKYDTDFEQILVLCPDTQKMVAMLARDERTNALFAQQTDADRERIGEHKVLGQEVKARGAAENRRLADEAEAEYGSLAYDAVQGVIGVPKAHAADSRIAFEVNDTARRHNIDPATPRPRAVQVIPADFAPRTNATNSTAPTGAGPDPRRPYAGKEGSLKLLTPIDPYADLEETTP